jgi:HSP20 family molecular chaperone IbpA
MNFVYSEKPENNQQRRLPMKSLVPWKKKEPLSAPAIWDDDWFGRPGENPFRNLLPLFSKSSVQMPTVEAIEEKNSFIVRAEVPGMTEKDIDLTWHDGILRISGEKKGEKEEKKKNRYYSERSYGYFSRDIPLGDSVDWKGAKARYHNGVLSVRLPKIQSSRKSIEVKVT